jgi:hypothetical protein
MSDKKKKSPLPGKPYSYGVDMVEKGHMTPDALTKAIAAGDIRPDPKAKDYGVDQVLYLDLKVSVDAANSGAAEHEFYIGSRKRK